MGDAGHKKRERYTSSKLYERRQDLDRDFLDRIPISATLFDSNGSYVIAAMVSNGKGGKVYVPIHITALKPFAEGLLWFGRVDLALQSAPALTNGRVEAHVFLVPGTHLYRHEKYTGSETLDVDYLWTAFTDDYKVLSENGTFVLKNLTPWLWDDV